jgi:hypothetical protein
MITQPRKPPFSGTWRVISFPRCHGNIFPRQSPKISARTRQGKTFDHEQFPRKETPAAKMGFQASRLSCGRVSKRSWFYTKLQSNHRDMPKNDRSPDTSDWSIDGRWLLHATWRQAKNQPTGAMSGQAGKLPRAAMKEAVREPAARIAGGTPALHWLARKHGEHGRPARFVELASLRT